MLVIVVQPCRFLCRQHLFDDTFLADGAEGNGFELQVISEHAFTVLHGQHQVFRAYSMASGFINARFVGSDHSRP